MPTPRRQRQQNPITVIDHEPEDESCLQDPEEFLDRNHPQNDQYMKSIEHVQRQIMHASSLLRAKQITAIKSVFSGQDFTEAGATNSMHPRTISRLVKSPNGQRLLSLLHYHLKLLEGPTEALRVNLLYRIAKDNEQKSPKTSIAAIAEINKMHFQTHQIKNPTQGPAAAQNQPQQIQININQNILPKGNLDR